MFKKKNKVVLNNEFKVGKNIDVCEFIYFFVKNLFILVHVLTYGETCDKWVPKHTNTYWIDEMSVDHDVEL